MPTFFEPTRVHSRGYLPHWESDHSSYFITWRLACSLPAHVKEQLRAEYRYLVRLVAGEREATGQEATRIRMMLGFKVDERLDDGHGRCYLALPQVAQIMVDALRHFDGKRYELVAWCVMPNHVHVLVRAAAGFGLARVVQSWKSFTAHAANRQLRRSGAFWSREYYDHIIRNDDELQRVVDYIRANPVKAGLHDWPWVG